MNERMSEIANQLGFFGPNFLVSTQELKKFAEMIVKECADIELYWLNEQDRKAVAEKIKQHFGIEDE